ncbi:hypothetical protein OAM67_01125 [bacterium]|nr:hypothetical protein [bacterium]
MRSKLLTMMLFDDLKQNMSTLQTIGQYAIHGLTGLAFGMGVCALRQADQKLQKQNNSTADTQMFSDYDGELLFKLRELSKMKEKFGFRFYSMYEALKHIIVLEIYIDHVPMSPNLSKTAHLYAEDVTYYAQLLQQVLPKFYPNDASEFYGHLKYVIDTAKASAHNVGLAVDDMMEAELEQSRQLLDVQDANTGSNTNSNDVLNRNIEKVFR